MGDTVLGGFSEVHCDDCGKKGCMYKHWGPLVPPGMVLTVCLECWHNRQHYYNEHGVAKPHERNTQENTA